MKMPLRKLLNPFIIYHDIISNSLLQENLGYNKDVLTTKSIDSSKAGNLVRYLRILMMPQSIWDVFIQLP